jgi:hypothetical protein
MAKNKSKFVVVSMTQIPESYLTKETLKALNGREAFSDTDQDLDEKIYTGDVFEAIFCEEMENGGSPFRIRDEATLLQLEELAREVTTEYVQITKI